MKRIVMCGGDCTGCGGCGGGNQAREYPIVNTFVYTVLMVGCLFFLKLNKTLGTGFLQLLIFWQRMGVYTFVYTISKTKRDPKQELYCLGPYHNNV